MLDVIHAVQPDDVSADASVDALEREVVATERVIARLRARQALLLGRLEAARVSAMDGARSMTDWTAARLDVTHDTARRLVHAARSFPRHDRVRDSAAAGEVTFDRALGTIRLAEAGAVPDQVAAAAGLDLAGIRRLAARYRRMSRVEEHQAYRERFVALQPALDESVWRLWGRLPGYEGRIVERALQQRADQLPNLPDDPQSDAGQRRADALVSVATDTLDRSLPRPTSHAPLVTVFVDAQLAATTNGQAGAEVATGPRVGPATLQRLLCDAAVQVVTHQGGIPVSATPATRTIPPATRRFVLWRDGGCVIDGCSSRYRLQPHHIHAWGNGGDHHADNLATLCWFHHHVAVHGHGYRIDPDSPPRRRRLHPPARGPDPP